MTLLTDVTVLTVGSVGLDRGSASADAPSRLRQGERSSITWGAKVIEVITGEGKVITRLPSAGLKMLKMAT